jgi:chromosome segregation ATPase
MSEWQGIEEAFAEVNRKLDALKPPPPQLGLVLENQRLQTDLDAQKLVTDHERQHRSQTANRNVVLSAKVTQLEANCKALEELRVSLLESRDGLAVRANELHERASKLEEEVARLKGVIDERNARILEITKRTIRKHQVHELVETIIPFYFDRVPGTELETRGIAAVKALGLEVEE